MTPVAVLRRLARIGAASPLRLASAGLLAVAAAMATVGLLAGSGYVVDRAAFRPGLGAIAGILAFVEVLAFVRGPLRYGERIVAHDASLRALTGWRVWLYNCLEPRSPAGLGTMRSGDLLSRAVDDVDTLLDLYVRGLMPFAVACFTSALAVVVVGLLLPWAALALGCCLLVAMVTAPLAALAARPGPQEATWRGEMAAEIVDLVGGAPELVAFGRDSEVVGRVDELTAALGRAARRRAFAAGLAQAAVTVCLGAAVVGVLTLGVWALAAHRLEPVMLAVLPLAAIGAFETVPALIAAAVRLADVVDAGRRLLELDALPIPVADPAQPEEPAAARPDITFEQARLRYGEKLPWALDGTSLHAEPGAAVALVGASGSGKTSVLNALLRFWPLESGRASLGGIDVARFRQRDVRRMVALLDQDAWVFAGTIRQNVVLSRPDASEDEIEDALRRAQLLEWTASLPKGLATQVGERGARLSGGQRQRLALARALLAGSQVLALDEPTSGLEADASRRLLDDVLRAARQGEQTVLMVTHRRDETEGFDEVLTMARGRVER